MLSSGPLNYEIRHVADACEFRASYYLNHPRELVWAAITEPDWLAQWLAQGTIDLRLGGRVHIDFEDSGTAIDSVITEFRRLSLLGYSWNSGDGPARPVRWELSPFEKGTRLTLTLRMPSSEDIAKASAGWDAHIQMLFAALEGVAVRFPVDYFLQAREEYGTALAGEAVD